MCYCGCIHEDYEGECRKPRKLPCPHDEEEMDAYCEAADWKYDQSREDPYVEDN